MGRVISTNLLALSALAVTVILSIQPDRLSVGVRIALVTIAVITALICAGIEIYVAWNAAPKKFKGEHKERNIREYMTKLLKRSNGRCVISSNDLSWVYGEAEAAMRHKAQEGNLELIMPSSNPLAESLCQSGATAKFYGGGSSEFRFESRFTIFNDSRSDCWVCVGHGMGDVHIIRKIHSNTDPILFLAKDLVSLARRVEIEKL